MPELPEVEMTRRRLVRWMDGRRVLRAEADETRVIPPEARARLASVKGRLRTTVRRGKHLGLFFGRTIGLYSHLGMTGKWVRRPDGEAPARYSRARLFLDDGSVLHFCDPRLFGAFIPMDQASLEARLAGLGRDPLEDGLDGPQLRAALGKTRQAIKVALMDQAKLAGLGNIHAAEALFRARLFPGRSAASLTDAELDRLARAILDSLQFGMEEQEGEEPAYLEEPGTPNRFLVYGRAGSPCVRCGNPVDSMVQAQRTTHYCPHCQPAPSPPAG